MHMKQNYLAHTAHITNEYKEDSTLFANSKEKYIGQSQMKIIILSCKDEACHAKNRCAHSSNRHCFIDKNLHLQW